MVFESLVVDLINKYLGDYVVKLDKSQLKLGLLGGNATLENLEIKENAFDEFDLPIKVRQGHISKLTLKIPWKHLYSEPVIAELDGLYVLIMPNSEMKYDPEKERTYLLEAKQKELSRIEENKQKRNDPKKETEIKDSFGEKLAAQIVKNLQINISNIHIRYEDTSTSPNRPFAVGITLANLSFQTCDEKGLSIVIKDDSTREFFKSVKMDSLAVYWNSNPKPFSSENRATLKAVMKNTIISSEKKLTDVSFLIQPISCSAMMHVHMKPETTNFSVPRMSLHLTLDQIGFAFNRNQYGDVAGFLDSIDRAWTKNRFRKYRPNVPLKSNIKTWWHFPYNVILEEQVRRTRRMWSWEYMQSHRKRCHAYTDLWEQKLLDKKLTSAEQETIIKCEEELDLLNITLCRQQAEMKVSKLKANKKAKKMRKKLNQKKTSSGGWFSGWFGKSETETSSSLISDGSDDLQKKVRNEFTQEEKAKLYQAIGYSEQTKDPDIPKEYVSLKLNLELQKLTFLLSDDTLKERKLMKLTIYSMSANVQQRSSADAISVNLIMNNMQVMGSKSSDGSIPTLVSTQVQSKLMNLLSVDFETNPIDQSANQKITIRAEPLEIVYDSDTINRIVKFLTPPEDLQLYELSTQVLASIEDVKEMTATGLRHLADQRIYTDIQVDIKPSYFILPEHGKYTKDCKMLLIDLGSTLIVSERTNMPASGDTLATSKDTKLDYDKMKETAYDKFHITLSTIQVLMIERGEDWRKLRSQETTKNHILRPFGFDFNLKKCTITNDANLPKIFIKGCLPHLGVILSDGVLQSVLELILHIPFPQTSAPKPVPTVESILKDYDDKQRIIGRKFNLTTNQVMRAINILPDSETTSLTSTIDEDDDEFKDALENLDDDVGNTKKKSNKLSQIKNLIDLDAVFVVNTVELLVLQDYKNPFDENHTCKEIVKLIVNDVGTSLTLRRFDMHVQAYIGSLMLAVPQFTDPITNLSICLAQTKKHTKGHNLLFIDLLIVEKTSPDFLTVHENTRHKLQCEFKSLEVCLHQEALLVLLNFANSLIPVLTPVDPNKTENWSSVIGDEIGNKALFEKENDYLEDKKRTLNDTSIIGVISEKIDLSNEKRNARMNAEMISEQFVKRKRVYIPETSMTQWAVTASLEKLRVIIASEKERNILDISIHGMRADVKTSYYTTELSVTITDMRIQDPNPQAVYKKIIWIDRDESIFSMQIVIFNQGTASQGFGVDLSKVDHVVNLEVGKIKIIFLYSFVVRIQEFFNTFQESLQTVVNKAQEYSEAAANKLSNVLEEPPSTRTKLDIRIKAPVIYMPENSKSINALMIDLGALVFKNEFALYQNSVVVLEESKLSLSNLRISRSILMENTVKNEKGILRPINISLDMTRNLSWNLNSNIPQISVQARMQSISVGMSQGDYNMLHLVLLSNIGEASIVNAPVVVPDSQIDSNQKKLVPKIDKIPKKVYSDDSNRDQSITVQFSFNMEFLDVELFKGDFNPNDWSKDMPAEKCLTKMKCENLSIDGCMHLNNEMEVNIKLSNINVLDTQPGSTTKINELIRNRKNDNDFISIKFVQDKLGNSKLIVDVAGIYMCICVDYLMMLTDFFIKAQPPPLEPPKKPMLPVRGYEKNPRKYRKKPQILPQEPRLADFIVDVHVARPEILLIEDMQNPDSNAIMLQTKFLLKYSLLKECDIFDININEFQAVFCPFKEENRNKNTMDIISPTSIALYCNKPINDGMQGSLTMEHLIINITPAVIQSISKITTTLTVQTTEDISIKDKTSIHNADAFADDDFWDMREFEDNEFLFISKGLMEKEKINTKDDGVESGFDVAQILLDVEQRRADQKSESVENLDDESESKIFLRLPDIKVILESEVAKKCVPMLIFECSMDGDLKNPTTNICLGVTVSVSISYFNDHINVWEPLIEVYPEENNRQYSFEIEYITCDDSGLFDEEDLEDLISVEPSAVSILLLSRDSLELTISRSALDVLSNLGKAFEEAYSLHLEEHKSIFGAPYVIKNTCGKDVVFYINKEFDLKPCNSDENFKVLLKINEEVQLYDAVDEKKSLITEEKQAKIVKFGYADSTHREYLSIYKTEVRALLFGPKDNEGLNRGGLSEREINTLIISTTAYLGMKQLELRSVLRVFNNTEDVLSLYYVIRKKQENKTEPSKTEVSKNCKLIEEVVGGKCFNVPIPVLLNSNGYIYISAKELNTEISTTGAIWNTGKNVQPPDTQILMCKTNTPVSHYYSAALSIEEVPIVNSTESVRTYRLDINVPLALHNQLPIKISYQSQVISHDIEPGCHEFVRTACLNFQSTIKITYEYQRKDWFGTLELGPKMEELSVINFKAKEGYTELLMDLGVHLLIKNGQASVTIYSPYWMINKTGHTLTYKAGDDYQVEHDASNKDAVLFSFLSKSIFAKKKETLSQTIEKAHLKIKDSLWSDKFSLDTVGSSGKVICKKKPLNYEVGVKINLSSSGLTKIVTFLPYYMILNQSSIVLYCNELAENAGWITVPPGEAVPFWPRSEVGKSMMMRCKVEDREVLVTQPFPFYESHSILMKLEKKFVGIFVEVQITEEANLINLQLYQDGMALVKLVNHLGDDVEIHYKQYGTPQEFILPAYHTVMYAWQDGRQKREIVWRIEGDNKKQHSNSLTSDGIEDFYINEMKAYWVSFVWDSHRILLFTNDIHVAKHARLSADLESIDQEITISLQSIGLSLVDNSLHQELAYISVTSSGVKWNQIRRKNRHKPLKLAQSEALEAAFDEFVNRLKTSEAEVEEHIVKVEGLEVDLSKKLMIKPEKCELIRVFEPGVFLQYRTSPHQVHVHLRVYKIQIDNQMGDCNFPVVFAPFPPPRSVALDTGFKPLIELSAVIIKAGETGAMRFKYFRVLIQEMQLMLDQGFVNSILDFVSGSVPDYNEEAMFVKDCQMIRDSLIDTSTIKSILAGGKKCVFDNFHISPIKIHLSFSLSRVNRAGKTALHSEVLNLFLQSVGIAITDMQDVIFKLGYFEKQNSIMPMNQMMTSITSHYVSQALRQMYVLVLGLDVLGNPFGVIRGMAQGVEDLFYEPVRGAVLGPEEFVEGVAYGVKSLFGHAVGGAAGAVSRIVGTMGKGIAALTLDADYQRKRREQLAKRPENLGVGLAQGGKGLIVGFVQGVTGVVTKPIDGAKKEGIEGFFKGVGKGLVGVVTRPVSGVVDFASSSFEGIRRVADTNIEVFRIRPPRYIAKDGVIRSYGLREAEGNNIWMKVTEKCDPIPNEVYIFHVYCKSKKNVIFLTNERIFHLDRNEILGIWSIQWQITYSKLDGPPVINETKRTIIFTLREKQRKLFSKDNITKEIEADLIVLKAVVLKVIKMQKYIEDRKQYTQPS